MQDLEPISLADAAQRLQRPYPTLRVWAHRYHAHKLGDVDGRAIYDYGDLALIEWHIRTGRPVPATSAERAAGHAQALARR